MPTSLLIHVRGDPSDVLDDTRLTPGFELEIVRAGVSLVAHLCGDAATSREVHHALALPEGVGEGLFTVNVFAERHRKHGHREMRVVGSRHDYRVDFVAHLVEHLTEIGEAACIAELFSKLLCMLSL